MKLVLTQHVKERRKKGNIPAERLRMLATYLIDSHKVETQPDGTYKFRRGGSCAIISKSKGKFIFITFYGATGWLIDNSDFTNFSCRLETEERTKIARERSKMKKIAISKGLKPNGKAITKLKPPLGNLNATNREKIKRGTFEIIELPDNKKVALSKQYGRKPIYMMVSKFDSYNIVEILSRDGGRITVLHKNLYDALDNIK